MHVWRVCVKQPLMVVASGRKRRRHDEQSGEAKLCRSNSVSSAAAVASASFPEHGGMQSKVHGDGDGAWHGLHGFRNGGGMRGELHITTSE